MEEGRLKVKKKKNEKKLLLQIKLLHDAVATGGHLSLFTVLKRKNI